MLLVATSYYYLNRVDPDCGTTFSWATKAFGPWVGWLGGWAIIVADIIVMANLADITAPLHVPALRASTKRPTTATEVMLIGVVWIAVMTYALLRRHRGVRQDAVVAARCGAGGARHTSRWVAVVRRFTADDAPETSVEAESRLAQSVHHRLDAFGADGRRARLQSSSIGAGTVSISVNEETEDKEPHARCCGNREPHIASRVDVT